MNLSKRFGYFWRSMQLRSGLLLSFRKNTVQTSGTNSSKSVWGSWGRATGLPRGVQQSGHTGPFSCSAGPAAGQPGSVRFLRPESGTSPLRPRALLWNPHPPPPTALKSGTRNVQTAPWRVGDENSQHQLPPPAPLCEYPSCEDGCESCVTPIHPRLPCCSAAWSHTLLGHVVLIDIWGLSET